MTTSEAPKDLVTATRAGQQELHERGVRPLPQPDSLTEPYWMAARQYELRIMRCVDCGAYRHPPTRSCRHCGSELVNFERLSGYGTVYSFTVVHRLLVPGFNEPYVVLLVNPVETTDDTVRIVSNLRSLDKALVSPRIGMRVVVQFDDVTPEITLPYFVQADI